VLVPFVLSHEPGVLLTKRTSHLHKHPGQVSFPGGRIDPDDASPEAAALREAQEEIGLDPALVEIVGRLPDYITGTGYHITPILGLLPVGRDIDDLGLALSPDEVESVFELKLPVLLDPSAPRRMTKFFRGRERFYWEYPHPEHHIWGATAAILVGLSARLRALG
jgi:8-oxo-dGTP pyrophosphatase MutT (NUDIX family)